jgi:hypothetical protein
MCAYEDKPGNCQLIITSQILSPLKEESYISNSHCSDLGVAAFAFIITRGKTGEGEGERMTTWCRDVPFTRNARACLLWTRL